MSRMGCLKTFNTTYGLGSATPTHVKQVAKNQIPIDPLSYSEWLKVTQTVKGPNGGRIHVKFLPKNELGLLYGAYLSSFKRER